ncbi:MAG: SdrD B-like domain-containing protein [Caldilineaceae bacterium]
MWRTITPSPTPTAAQPTQQLTLASGSRSALGNLVWLDLNNDGLFDNGIESGIEGVTVTLSLSGTVIATTTTDSAGHYTFTNLLPGDYIVNIPAENFEAGGALAGLASTADPATAADINGNTNDDDNGAGIATGAISSAPVTLSAGDEPADDGDTNTNSNLTVDFGFNLPLVLLGNRLWIEDDNDGDATTGNVTPVAGQVVTATSSSGVVYTGTTDVNGLYTITVPANDTYTVTTGIPADVVDSSVLVFDGSDPQTNNNLNHDRLGTTVAMTITDNLSLDFGYYQPAQFGDRVWIESDSDGDVATGMITPVAGMVITATASDGTEYVETTDAAGYYSFTVPGDTYTVTYGTVPAGYGVVVPSSTPGGNRETGNGGAYQDDADLSHENNTTVTVIGGEANWHVDFAFYAPMVQIGDRLWIEDDNDGDATTGNVTPVAGQVVTATTSSGAVYTTTTNADGIYTITVPANDTYTVTTGIPADVVDSPIVPNAGNDENHDRLGTTVVVTTTDNLSIDFGYYLATQFGDRVWIESDSDGLANTGTIAPVAGMVITATNGTDVYTTTTNADGYYSFTVPGGVYEVTYGDVPASYGVVVPSATLVATLNPVMRACTKHPVTPIRATRTARP